MSRTRQPLDPVDFLAKLTQVEAMMKATHSAPADPSRPSAAHPSNPCNPQTGVPCRLQGPLNQFAFDLFAQRLQEPNTANALISPASIALALGMVLAGTVDPVEADIRAMFHASSIPPDEMDHCFSNLQRQLMGGSDGVRLAIANSLWGALGRVSLLPSYVTACQEIFNAEAATVDFGAPETVDLINGWVSDHTEGKITELIGPPTLELSILILINALYFKGSWQTPFDPANTRDGAFTLGDGSTVTVPMMSRMDEYMMADFGTFSAVRLPYGKEGRFGMVILLPDRGSTLADLTAGVNSRSWYGLLAKLHPSRAYVTLPRFKVEDEWNLVRPLKALGIGSAFADASGFRKMMEGPAVIGEAIHKVFMEVNEEGTEAAAATAVMMSRSIPPSIEVDRPFALAIHDEETGSILFLGQVMDPR